MFKPKRITCVEDCTTPPWKIQAFGIEAEVDARKMAARLFIGSSRSVRVSPHQEKWAIFYTEGVH